MDKYTRLVRRSAWPVLFSLSMLRIHVFSSSYEAWEQQEIQLKKSHFQMLQSDHIMDG